MPNEYSWILAEHKKSRVIGYNSAQSCRLPWKHPGDLRFFRKCTEDSAIIIGHNTWKGMVQESYPLLDRERALVNLCRRRHWFVLTRGEQRSVPCIHHEEGSVHYIHSPSNPQRMLAWIDFVLHAIRKDVRGTFVAGGKEVWRFFSDPTYIFLSTIQDAPILSIREDEVPVRNIDINHNVWEAAVTWEDEGVDHHLLQKKSHPRGKIPDIFLDRIFD